MEIREKKIAVIGLGYVGLPLAVEFAKKGFNVLGYDINLNRINELKQSYDSTEEVSSDELKSVAMTFSTNNADLEGCKIYIVTVPTPIDEYKTPNLSPLISASRTVGEFLKKGDIVIYESTVFPGCTEEVCVPELEKTSKLTYNKDFFCGYSPERINPGDKVHRVNSIVKVTSGSNKETAETVDYLYSQIIDAGTHLASSIKVAEAAKVIENTQRDLNIAFVNELSLIFEKMNIETSEVLAAAGTKWNFLNFRPGLVGGHCIGVDPYYLTYKAQSLGYNPEVILAGRRINDNMGKNVARRYLKLLLESDKNIRSFKTLVLGFTFKENCPDIRNTRVIDVYRELKEFGLEADIYDPIASSEEIKSEYNIDTTTKQIANYDGIILAVAHDEFHSYDWHELSKSRIIFDVKNILPHNIANGKL